MDLTEEPDTRTYSVVKNDEEQYSIWPVAKPRPLGWRAAGYEGSKDECLAYIREVWTDITPKSVRISMATPPVTREDGDS